MRSTIFYRRLHSIRRLGFAAALVLTLLSISYPAIGACPDIADIPLNTMEQSAPGMIMFVLDDSGSMDWSIMCPPSEESGGVFNGTYYIFSNPGDDLYGYTNLEDDNSKKNMWMSQWAGYNGMYYDPATEYTPWPSMADADIDNPRSNPVNSTPTLDMTTLWYEWDEYGIIVDNDDASGFTTSVTENNGTGNGYWQWNNSGSFYDTSYYYSVVGTGTETFTATWTATGLDTSTTYDVYAWCRGGNSTRIAVDYVTYADTTVTTEIDQATQYGDWYQIASGVSFNSTSGTGVVQISEDASTSQVDADAIKFVPLDNPVSDIARRHYYVRGTDGRTYLVNLLDGTIEYYWVDLASTSDKREVVYANMLNPLTAAEAAAVGIVTGRTYTEECQNFANWYSYYRRRELTAKNAIANAINDMDGVYIGLIFINNYRGKDTAVKPVKVNLNETLYDESADLLDILYNYQYSSYGTPLRYGLKKAGRYFEGDYLKPATLPSQTSSSSYPFFTEDEGGSCQMAFTVIFSDGYYNGSSPSVGNTDGGTSNSAYDGSPFADSYSDTLADVAMHYYERDLNTSLSNFVSASTQDPADHQHMVTYTLAFGVTGSLDTSLYEDCPTGTCPTSWPSPSSDQGKIDDMFHAAINGRGKYMSASSSAELNEALQVLKESIEKRLGSGAGLASSSIQRTVGTRIFRGTYNTSNWYGEISALPVDAETGDVGSVEWLASDHVPTWSSRNILSFNGSSGIEFFKDNLSAAQVSTLEASGLGTAEQLVNFIRGDTSNNVASGGSLRTRLNPIGDIVHSAPTYYNDTVYIGANDGMLHAVSASTGAERFTYVPALVYDQLAELADPGYSHKYYVDGTPTVVNAGGTHLLVCGLGKGGKGYFALDVSAPDSMDAGSVLWEFTDADDMGYSYSKPIVARTASDGWVVIVGNGYASTNGEAILYVLSATDGTVLRKIKTGATGCNGLSEPAVADPQLDGIPDYAYAGDLKGNMWKFDLRGDVADWDVYYQDSATSTPMPLVTVATWDSGTQKVQPITVSSDIMLDCARLQSARGLMVLFGTGQYLNADDFTDTTVQSLYGIWDWAPIWEYETDLATAKTKYLGTLQEDRSLSNLGTTVTLLEQTVTSQTTQWYKVSSNPIEWYLPVSGAGSHMGWVFDMPETGERCLQEPELRSGTVLMISTTPSSSPCDAGGSSTIWALNACSGGSTLFWDENDDGVIDELDDPVSGKITEFIIPDILIMSDILYYPGDDDDDEDDDDIEQEEVQEDPVGMFYWRTLER